MLDIKLIRENPELIKNNLKKRIGFDITIIDEVLKIDASWRTEKHTLDILKSEKNTESKKIAKIKKNGKDIKTQLEKIKKIADEIDSKEKKLKELEEKRESIHVNIPNLLDENVPVGTDENENTTIRTYKDIPKFDFEVRNHQELCEFNNWYELEQAAKNSGARFYYLKGEIVMLEIVLYNYVLEKLMKKGYTPVEVPPMVRKKVLEKSIPLADFEDVIYKIENEDLYLIGTSEHALAALHDSETLDYKDLPIKYAGLSPSYRKEAGVTKDSKGIFRVHNFNKIEQFIFSKQEDSERLHEELIKNAEDIFKELDIPYQIINICSGDIGNFATKKYDLEAWLPGQKQYREMVSASNYKDYGARRLNCRYQNEKNELKFVHTLNSTAIALTRCMIAIIENHQTKDGNVKLPNVLQKYFGREYLIKK